MILMTYEMQMLNIIKKKTKPTITTTPQKGLSLHYKHVIALVI